MTARKAPEVIQLRHGLSATVLTYADLGRRKPRRKPVPKPTPPPTDTYDEEPW